MTMSRRIIAVPLVVGALIVAACAGPGPQSPSIALAAESDLPSIILGVSDPPEGTKFSSTAVGDGYLHVQSRLVPPTTEDGFVGGAEIEFIPTTSERTPTQSKLDGGIVSGAVLFRDAARASATFAKEAQDYGSRLRVGGGIAPVNMIPSDVLGEESFGIRGSFYPGAPSFDFVLYVWRISNLVLYVYGWGAQGTIGSADPAELLGIATAMLARAERPALDQS